MYIIFDISFINNLKEDKNMKLVLNCNGTSDPFSSYLKKFGKLRKSLLLEIDPNAKMFVSKSYAEDRSVVRYSSLTFDDANFSIRDYDTIPDTARIKLGIIVTLDKFIKILDRFNTEFFITFNFDVLDSDGNVDYICQSVDFKSKDLKMRLLGSKISEFHYLSDDVFNNNIFKVYDSVTILVSSSVLQNIIKTSDIVATDPKKDALIFYTNSTGFYVKDRVGRNDDGSDKESNFEYCITTDVEMPSYEIRLPISRERIVQVLSTVDEDFNIILGKDINGNLTRILFNAVSDTTKIVISTLNEA